MRLKPGVFARLATIRGSTWPAVGLELQRWLQRSQRIEDTQLRAQAQASLRLKGFHCYGGSVFAAAGPSSRHADLIQAICALQTISDYLDNLCDRLSSRDGSYFRRLHASMFDAVSLEPPTGSSYYTSGPQESDYLPQLVAVCRHALARLPRYSEAAPLVAGLLRHYVELQVRKHIHPDQRVPALQDWHQGHCDDAALYWWEFSAACGSTLGIFALFLWAASPSSELGANELAACYFPYVQSLHILLDYLIDQDEDQAGGDLNFVSYYPDQATRDQRLRFLVRRASAALRHLDDSLHHLLVPGLLAMYLSDPKVSHQGLGGLAHSLLWRAGPLSPLLYAQLRYKDRLLWTPPEQEKGQAPVSRDA